jgi:hypothetical protein
MKMNPPTRVPSSTSSHKIQKPHTPITFSELEPNNELLNYAQVLSENIVEQSAASAAIAAAKANSSTPGGHKETVSVVGFEETAELESGAKWGDRTPTPTFRMATPPVPHCPPTPPADIPSIFLAGPLPTSGQQLMVSDSQTEVEGGGDDYDDDVENMGAPVVLSGRVTLSVISGVGGAVDDITEASSLESYDDRAQAANSRSSKKDGLASFMKYHKLFCVESLDSCGVKQIDSQRIVLCATKTNENSECLKPNAVIEAEIGYENYIWRNLISSREIIILIPVLSPPND